MQHGWISSWLLTGSNSLEGPGHEGRVVVHDEVEQHAEEDLAAGAVQVQDGALLRLVTEDLLSLLANALQSQQ